MNYKNLITIILSVLVVLWLVRWINSFQNNKKLNTQSSTSTWTPSSSNIVFAQGRQEVTITAGHGYEPKLTTAKAGVPTTLKLQGKNAFGCESSVRIASLNYAKNLDANGSDTITLPEQKAWDTINGTCSMGMYKFQVKFE